MNQQQTQPQGQKQAPKLSPAAQEMLALEQRVTQSEASKMLQQFLPIIKKTLPSILTGERMARTVLNSMRENPLLLNCEPASIIGSVLKAAQVGLEIGGPLAHAHLVPYGKECQFILGYKGRRELQCRSGRVKGMKAEKVMKGDRFEYGVINGKYTMNWQPGDHDRSHDHDFELVPAPSGKGKVLKFDIEKCHITHVFTMVDFDDGSSDWQVITIKEIEKIRQGRKNQYDKIWDMHYGEMCKKTGVIRHSKMLPQTSEAAEMYELENRHEQGLPQNNAFVMNDFAPGFINVDYRVEQNEGDGNAPDKVMPDSPRKTGDAAADYLKAVERLKVHNASPLIILKRSQKQIDDMDAAQLGAATDILNAWADKEEP